MQFDAPMNCKKIFKKGTEEQQQLLSMKLIDESSVGPSRGLSLSSPQRILDVSCE